MLAITMITVITVRSGSKFNYLIAIIVINMIAIKNNHNSIQLIPFYNFQFF